MEDDTEIDDDEMLSNEEQVELVFHALQDALTDEVLHQVCIFNVLIGINELALDWAMGMHEEFHMEEDDDEDESPYGNLPGTSFSKS
jgi:hypothetical protein